MLNVQYGHDQMLRVDKEVLVTIPETVIPEGAAVKLDAAGKIVLSGANAAVEDFVWFAFNSANVPDDINSAQKATGNITLIKGTFVAETDQFVTGDVYAVGDDLIAENGLLSSAKALGDWVIGKVIAPPAGGILLFYSYATPVKV